MNTTRVHLENEAAKAELAERLTAYNASRDMAGAVELADCMAFTESDIAHHDHLKLMFDSIAAISGLVGDDGDADMGELVERLTNKFWQIADNP